MSLPLCVSRETTRLEVLLGDNRDVEKLRKLRRRNFHKGMMIYEEN
jgi:hypothetical protein